MLYLIALAAAASSTITIVAPPTRTVMVDGSPVTYQAEQRRDGTRRLYGLRLIDQAPFEFIARPDGRVHGTVGHEAVSFRMS